MTSIVYKTSIYADRRPHRTEQTPVTAKSWASLHRGMLDRFIFFLISILYFVIENRISKEAKVGDREVMQEESCNRAQDLGPQSPWDMHSSSGSFGLALASLTCHPCGLGTGVMQYVLKPCVSKWTSFLLGELHGSYPRDTHREKLPSKWKGLPFLS